MSTTTNRVLSLFRSRLNLLEQLEHLEYDVTDYSGFSINEIDAMSTHNQLDMLVTNKNGRKAFVKYYLDAKQIRVPILSGLIEDLYTIDNVLSKEDTLIVVTEDEPNDSIISHLKYIYEQDGVFVVIHNIKRLQFNLLKHRLVPPCVVLKESEVKEVFKKYNISSVKQLPEISRFDPQALVNCIRPGQVCMFRRSSQTAMEYDYYRLCV